MHILLKISIPSSILYLIYYKYLKTNITFINYQLIITKLLLLKKKKRLKYK